MLDRCQENELQKLLFALAPFSWHLSILKRFFATVTSTNTYRLFHWENEYLSIPYIACAADLLNHFYYPLYLFISYNHLYFFKKRRSNLN